MRARVAQCDAVSSTDTSHFAFLKRQDRLLPYRPRNAEWMIRAARDAAAPDGHYQITYLALYLLARRADRVLEPEAPRSWRDLTDPKWRDRLAVRHPGCSGAIASWCVMMRRMYSWD